MVEIQNATIEVTKSPTSFMLTQIEEKSTWQYQQLTRLLLIIHIDHVTVTYAYLWNCHGGRNLSMWRRQKLNKLFQCVRGWDFDGIGTFHYTCSKP